MHQLGVALGVVGLTGVVQLPLVTEVVGPSDQELVAFDVAPTGDLVTVWREPPPPFPWSGEGLVSLAPVPVPVAEVEAMRSAEERRRAEAMALPVTIRRLNRRTGEIVDTQIVPGIEVERVSVSDRHLVLVGPNWDADVTAAVWDVRTGELRRGLLGWDIADVVVSARDEIWIGYGDQACYGDPPREAPRDVVNAMRSGLAVFTVDFELVWGFDGLWDRAPKGLEHVYFIHSDGDGGAVVWDGLGDSLTFFDSSGRVRQVAWDSEQLNIVGVLRNGGDVNLLATDNDDDHRLVLVHGSPGSVDFVAEWSEPIEVSHSDALWRSEKWRTRDDRVDLVTNDRWYSATLGELFEQRS